MKFILFLIGFLLPVPGFALPQPMPSAPLLAAKSYLLYDHTSNQILVNQNGDARMEPASLTKLMTAYLTFDALKHGTISLQQELTVPYAATRIAGGESRMLLKAEQSVTVDELLRGLIVQSGNDAAITLALNIAGSETGFVDLMNKEAKRLGMVNTHFSNPVGLSDAQHYSSASDLALLAAAIVHDYPQHYHLFGQREYTFNNVTQANRNRLLWIDPYGGRPQDRAHRDGRILSGRLGQTRQAPVVLGVARGEFRQFARHRKPAAAEFRFPVF